HAVGVHRALPRQAGSEALVGVVAAECSRGAVRRSGAAARLERQVALATADRGRAGGIAGARGHLAAPEAAGHGSRADLSSRALHRDQAAAEAIAATAAAGRIAH